MQQILFFLIRNKNFLLSLFLFLISFALTIQSHSFHKNKFINSANFFSGGIYSFKNNVNNYFNLKEENDLLLEENARLRMQLDSFDEFSTIDNTDSTFTHSKFQFETARVINNTYSKSKNILTIDKGSQMNIALDMGVISSKGLIGIIKNTSAKYATVQSILNINSQINAKLKNSNHFGSLIWNTEDPNIVQLIEIPRLAPIIVGDTIITGGKSTIFPEGVLVGTIQSSLLNKDKNSYTLNIKLFNDMTSLKHVYIINNKDTEEIKKLEKESDDAE